MFLVDDKGTQQVTLEVDVYARAKEAKLSVAQYINREYKNADQKYGTAFEQLCASEGLSLLGKGPNPFGLRSPTMASIMDGSAGYGAASNVDRKTDPFGVQSRTLFPAFVINAIEDQMQPDRVTDSAVFRQMSATTVPVAGDTFNQPVISYQNVGGANTGTNAAKAARVVQGCLVPTMLFLGTTDRYRTLPTYGIGIEMSDKALLSTTLDLFTLTLNRFMQIEKDQRVYTYLSNLFAGDLDHNTGAVSSVSTTTLDSAATGGVVTHKSWVMFLARNRKKRHITHAICDLATYLKIEGRTGRPGSNAYDPTLARIDPQLVPVGNVPFGSDVQWMIVDDAASGGPVPANTVWALDATQAFMMVENTEAAYQATQEFVLRRTSTAIWHWSEEAFRLWGDAELTAFDILTIA